MEVLLNICWFLLIAPGAVLWVRSRANSRPLQSAAALACSLILLFPVVSVSDDLRAVCQEMEECGASKRVITKAGSAIPGSQDHFGYFPAIGTATVSIHACDEPSDDIRGAERLLPKLTVGSAQRGRAPPFLFLS